MSNQPRNAELQGRTRRMSIAEVDGASLVLVLRQAGEDDKSDPGFDCDDCPGGPHWHVNSYRGPDYTEHRLAIRRLLAEWVRDDA